MDMREMWDSVTPKKRKELLKVMGHHPSWAEAKYDEIGPRGGGMLKRDMARLWDKFSGGKR